jgi:hypothetical protein
MHMHACINEKCACMELCVCTFTYVYVCKHTFIHISWNKTLTGCQNMWHMYVCARAQAYMRLDIPMYTCALMKACFQTSLSNMHAGTQDGPPGEQGQPGLPGPPGRTTVGPEGLPGEIGAPGPGESVCCV